MPKRILELTDLQVKNAKPKEKSYKLTDGKGLFLLVTPSGGKLWRFKYRFGGIEKLLTFKSYPEISLVEARKRRDEARQLIANGVDPGALIKEQKVNEQIQSEVTANTFKKVAIEWFDKNKGAWSESHCNTIRRRLERDVYPVIGDRPITGIKRIEIVSLIKSIDAKGISETADRIKIYCGQIFRYALNNAYIELNPATDLKDIVSKRAEKHHAAIIDPKQIGPLLRAIDDYAGTYTVKCALQLAPLVFLRPGELQKGEWSEIDLDAAEWNIPACRMKTKKPHLVPLAKQAVTLIRELHKLTGGSKFLFPSLRSSNRPMSNVAMIAAFRRMGYSGEEMTPHGFRAIARTLLDEIEELDFDVDIIEHQLAHAVKDANGTAYNRTTKLPQRRQMMQRWADYLDQLKKA